MTNFNPIQNLPENVTFNENDTVVIFGEVFARGYVNGLIEKAQSSGAKVIFSTMGRRDNKGPLRPLTHEELAEKEHHPLINVPLEAGFDLDPCSDGSTVCDQLDTIKLKDWQDAKLDWGKIEECIAMGQERFKAQIKDFFSQLAPLIHDSSSVTFVHTMAGGVPRSKIIMALMNRVFKGHGERFLSSKVFWDSEIGQLCARSFEEVTAHSFQHLITESKNFRENMSRTSSACQFLAYGYHGNELLINNDYKWQSYAPYLQGFAKKSLENYASEACNSGANAVVFNVPEILTNSSSIFLGIEIALYPLMKSFLVKAPNNPKVIALKKQCETLLKPEYKLEDIFKLTDEYFSSSVIKNEWSLYDQWPQHNGPEQMSLMRKTSQSILEMHKNDKQLLTAELSEIIFQASGEIMLNYFYGQKTKNPVCWIGHDLVTQWFIKG